MVLQQFFLAVTIVCVAQTILPPVAAFTPSPTTNVRASLGNARICNNHRRSSMASSPLRSSPEDKSNAGVIDLTEDDDDDVASTSDVTPQTAAPFLSQGELSDDPNLLSPDFKDPKQTRVIVYIILTLVPVLFLVPLMIGSRDLIPLDALPPVDMQQ